MAAWSVIILYHHSWVWTLQTKLQSPTTLHYIINKLFMCSNLPIRLTRKYIDMHKHTHTQLCTHTLKYIPAHPTLSLKETLGHKECSPLIRVRYVIRCYRMSSTFWIGLTCINLIHNIIITPITIIMLKTLSPLHRTLSSNKQSLSLQTLLLH